jgi:hypothetical protein
MRSSWPLSHAGEYEFKRNEKGIWVQSLVMLLAGCTMFSIAGFWGLLHHIQYDLSDLSLPNSGIIGIIGLLCLA